MFTTKVATDIEFAYLDSGAPLNVAAYTTIILIHGHTYHSAVFKPMIDQANEFGFRLIAPNRRLYPGSTPYTSEEADSLHANQSVEDRTHALIMQGKYLLMLISDLIIEHALQNVLVCGWSLGGAFATAAVAAITAVSKEMQHNLSTAVKSIILWDPPFHVYGLPDPPTGGWLPIYDDSIPAETRGQFFCHWLTQYYPHPDLHSQDYNTLIYKLTTPAKPATFMDISNEEMYGKVDLSAGANGDTFHGDRQFLAAVRRRAMFDSDVRAAWVNVPFTVMYGEESIYSVLWGAWKLQEEAENMGLDMKVFSMAGANHFAMYDLPKISFNVFKACI